MSSDSNTDVSYVPPVDPDVIEGAKQRLAAMTPQALLEMEDLVYDAQAQGMLHEAGGVAWTDVYGLHGGKMSVTARGVNPVDAINKLMDGVRYLMSNFDMGWSPVPPKLREQSTPVAQQPARTEPQQAQYISVTDAVNTPTGMVGQAQQQPKPAFDGEFVVDTFIANVVSGKVYWKAKGGPFKQFGVTVWPEVLAEAGFNADALDVRQAYDLTGFTAHYIEEGGKATKVTRLERK